MIGPALLKTVSQLGCGDDVSLGGGVGVSVGGGGGAGRYNIDSCGGEADDISRDDGTWAHIGDNVAAVTELDYGYEDQDNLNVNIDTSPYVTLIDENYNHMITKNVLKVDIATQTETSNDEFEEVLNSKNFETM